MDNQEIPESVQEDILNAELTPDERMVAEEDAIEELQGNDLFSSEDTPEAVASDDPIVDPQSNGQVIDDYTIRRAQQYNFSEEQIKGFADQEHLTQTLNLMDKELLNQPAAAEPQQAEAAGPVQSEGRGLGDH